MLTQISEQQANKVVAINENFEAMQSASLFGINRALSIGLLFAYYGGVIWNGSAYASIADDDIALSGSATNYIEADSAGTVYKNTTGFTAGRIPLYVLVTSSTGITTATDYRISNPAYSGGPGMFKFLTLASGTLTDSAPALTITQTWNDAAEVFVGADMNITDTASDAASILQRWRVGGSAVASLLKTGALTLAAGLTAASLTISGAAAFNGNTTIGDASGDTLTINAGTWTIGSNYISTRAAGTLAAAAFDTFVQEATTFTGNAAGNSSGVGKFSYTQVLGANDVSTARSLQNRVTHSGSGTINAAAAQYSEISIASTGNIATGVINQATVLISSTGGVTGTLSQYQASAPGITGAGTIANLVGFTVGGIGHANVTTAIAFRAQDMSGSTNMRGAQLSLSSGTGKFNLFIDGTAQNYVAGIMGLGSTTLVSDRYLQISGTGDAAGIDVQRNSNDTTAALLRTFKSRNTTIGAHTVVQSGDVLFAFQGFGSDGSAYRQAANIQITCDGTPGASDMPGAVFFYTTPDGSATPVARVKIGNQGNVILNNSGSALATNATGGFTYLPSCAGAPTGVPAVLPTGVVPMVWDSTNHKLYVYSGGAWKGGTTPGAFA